MLVGRMIAGGHVALAVGDVHHLFPVGGNVGEPAVLILMMGHLRLFGAVLLHAEGLHQPRTHGIEPDVFAAGAVFRAVVQTGRIGQARFFAALCRNGVHVIIAVSVGAVAQRFPVRRPAVQVAGPHVGHLSGFAAGDGQDVDAGMPVRFLTVADSQILSVCGQNVVVVAVIGAAGIDAPVLARFHMIGADQTVLIVDQKAVPMPVGRFKAAFPFKQGRSFPRFHVEHFHAGKYLHSSSSPSAPSGALARAA